MRRRTILVGMASVTGALAGCLQAQGSPEDDSSEDDPDPDQPGASSPENGSEDEDPEPSLETHSVETVGSGCAEGDGDDASVDVGDGVLTLEGTIQASNPCHEALLEAVTLEDRTLSVTVDVEDAGGMCTTCVGEIQYEATFEIENVESVESANVDHVGGGSFGMGWDSASESAAPPDEDQN